MQRGRGRCRPVTVWEGLEPRRLMCSAHLAESAHLSLWATAPEVRMSSSSSPSVASVSAATVSIAANAPSGLPWLHSLPGAPVAIFLDFDGYGSSAPYDTDG